VLSRLTLDFTYFDKRTVDVIVSQPIAPSSGFPGSQLRNLGRVDNHGVELSATLQAMQRRSLAWEIVGKFATNNDIIKDLGGLPSIIGSFGAQNVVGYPIGGIFSKRVLSADRNPTTNQATNVLCDNGSGVGVACATAPYLYLGTPTPKVSGALSSTLTLGGRLRLYGLADFKRGNLMQNSVELLRCTSQLGAALCRENYYPEEYATTELAQAVGNAIAVGTVERYMQDASFVKLRELSATYTLPERWIRGRSSLTVAGRELYTWTKYRGLDPEANANNPATTAATNSQAVTPPLTRLLVTLNVSF
jgi:TonB-dependent starch-binding outer membrane protein SusC